jgi:hypothetical protein
MCVGWRSCSKANHLLGPELRRHGDLRCHGRGVRLEHDRREEEGFRPAFRRAAADVESDSVLYEKNGDQLIAPALAADDAEYVSTKSNRAVPSRRTSLSSARMLAQGGLRGRNVRRDPRRISLDDPIHGIIIDPPTTLLRSPKDGRQRGRIRRQTTPRGIGLKNRRSQRHRYSDQPGVTARELTELAPHHTDLLRIH